MSKTHRVLNLSRGLRLKLAQAERAVEVCAAVWVEKGISIRDATLSEAIALRNAQAALRERLACAELPGLLYQPSGCNMEGYRRERRLMAEASLFAERAGCVGAVEAQL